MFPPVFELNFPLQTPYINGYTQHFLNSLISKQKMAIRCVTNLKYNCHTAPLFKKEKILPFDLLVQYFQMLFMHDHKHKRIPRSFYDVWRTIEENKIQYPVRNTFDYRINQARICLTEDCQFVHCLRFGTLIVLNKLRILFLKKHLR